MNEPSPPAGSAGHLPPPPPPPPAHEKGGGSAIMRRIRERQHVAAEMASAVAPSSAATTDVVTGLPTRADLSTALRIAVTNSHQKSDLAVLAFVEAGELRDLNDVLGPDVGDELLRQVAARLLTIDVPGTEVLRYEGAVFSVIFPDVPNVGGADTTAEFLIDLLSKPFELGAHQAGMGPMVGAAVSADNYDNLDDMIRDAYQALLSARERGPGAFVVHDETRRTRFSTRIDDRRLQDAIADHEFALFYQPIMALSSGQVAGAEALIRWLQPAATNIGMLFPHDFLPLLEKSGRIVEVGQWVLDDACRQLAEWRTTYPDADLFISCNIGAHELADPGLADSVVRAVEKYGVDPNQLGLDITEEALRHNQHQRDVAWARLRLVKDMGVKLALDDFGTGMASLDVLREMHLDILRIDRLFVSGLGLADEDRILVKNMTQLAHDLGCLVIAEGVETDEQEAILQDLGVDYAQGFKYGRPEKAATFAEHLGH